MNDTMNRVGNDRQNDGTSSGTEFKKPDIFSTMAYLGKSESAQTTEKSVEKTSENKGEKKATKKRGGRSRQEKANAESAAPAKEERAQRGKKVYADRGHDRNAIRSMTDEERKRLREQLIAETNSYLTENEKAPEKKGAQGNLEKVKKQRQPKKNLSAVKETPEPEKVEKQTKKQKDKGKKPVKVLFLGGVGEIGKNMTALEYGNDIIIIDAGMSFPDEEMPGVDVVLPDIGYLVKNKDKIKGIFITHGHEDHIGGIPYLLKQINPKTPIYGTKLTLALADNKIREHRISNVVMKAQAPGDRVKAGCFEVEFVNVNHSISGAVAFAIDTPCGLVYHSGDFKIDLTPVAGEPIDLKRIAQLGDKGVTLYLGESTNIERPGYTMSETVVGTTFEHLFAENTERRIVIATFASNVHRLKQIIDVAVRYNRKVALSGRSMLNVVEAASKIGELTIPEGVLVDVEKIKNYFDKEIVIISTGTQGEPMSALTRMANGEYNKVTIGSNDTVILSATPIPGNEKMIYKVINNLYKKGANVVYESLEKVHVSGHACQEEHKIIHRLLKPKFFIPVHGEYRHLKRHALLAEDMGTPESHVIIPDVGNQVEFTENSIRRGNNFPAGVTIIDGSGSEDFSSSEVMRDRRLISAEGMFVVALAVSDGVVVGDPVIENRGVMLPDDRDYEKDMLKIVRLILDKWEGGEKKQKALTDEISKELRGFLTRKTKQSPLILPLILNV